jgi:hypothetical protein
MNIVKKLQAEAMAVTEVLVASHFEINGQNYLVT